MSQHFNIRRELPSDAPAITDITVAAFSTALHSSRTEQFIVASLRQSGVLSLSLVAEIGSQPVGHVALFARHHCRWCCGLVRPRSSFGRAFVPA